MINHAVSMASLNCREGPFSHNSTENLNLSQFHSLFNIPLTLFELMNGFHPYLLAGELNAFDPGEW